MNNVSGDNAAVSKRVGTDMFNIPYGTSYSTTYLRNLSKGIDDIRKTLYKENLLMGNMAVLTNVKETRLTVLGLMDPANATRQFLHPVIDVDNNCVYIDCRPYLNNKGRIRDRIGIQGAVLRGLLEVAYINGMQGFNEYSDTLTKVFSTWVNNQLTRSLNLEVQDSYIVEMVALWYYTILTLNNGRIDNKDAEELFHKRCVSVLRLPGEFVKDASQSINKVGMLNDVSAAKLGKGSLVATLAKYMKEGLNDNYDIDERSLVNGLGKIHIGPFANEISMVAIESPAAFLFALMNANGNSMYNKMSIGIALNKWRKDRLVSGQLDNATANFRTLLRNLDELV